MAENNDSRMAKLQEKGGGLFGEFKEFINKGNVMDLAVAVVMGAAFTAIVTSLVDDIIMPLISALTGGIDFSSWAVAFGTGEHAAKLTYGNFIGAVINFLLISIVIFIMVKGMNSLRRKEEVEEVATTKICPFCKSEIDLEATKCPHCTSDQPAADGEEAA